MMVLDFKNRISAGFLFLSVLFPATNIYAGDVDIIAADFRNTGADNWKVNVTLRHDDSGWQHYADNWRVVDAEGTVLGDRVLFHPHVNEQPFTRSLSNVKIPRQLSLVYIEAHDKRHGWTKNRLRVDLSEANMGRLKVVAE